MRNFLSVIILVVFCFLMQPANSQYSWRKRACLPSTPRAGEAAFGLNNNKGYVVCGRLVTQLGTNEVWQYDPALDVWTQKGNFPGFRINPGYFIINNVAYVGLGLDNGGTYYSDFYKYDPITDSWTAIANFPGPARYTVMSFVINGKAYVGCGKDGGSEYHDFYEYDPAGNVWTQKADFPGSNRQTGLGFGLGNYGYMGLGYDGSAKSDMYKYDPSNNTWAQLANFPGPARWGPSVFTINDTVYIAAGRDPELDDCWRYNVANDSWVQEASFTCVGPPRDDGYGFDLNGHGYVFGGGFGGFNYGRDLLEFGPLDVSFTSRVHVLGNDTAFCSAFSQVLSTGNACTVWSTGDVASQITVTAAGTYWARFPDTCGMVSDTINIAQGAPVANFGNDTTYCGPFWRVLSTGVNSTIWSTGDTASQILVGAPGTYWAHVTDACGTASDTIIIFDKPAPIVNLGSDTFLCYSQTLLLNATNNNSSYQWQDNSSNPTYKVTTSGSYSVTVTDTSGCSVKDTIQVNYALEAPQPDLGGEMQICGDSTLLHAGIPNARYLWNDNSTDSVYHVYTSGVYSVTVTDGCGTGTASVNVGIHTDECALLIPTGFSPNGDGKNDVFRAISHCQATKFTMLIYNRWGEQVFQTNDITEGWDGTFHNKNQPMSVYVYYIEYFNFCENKIKKIGGNVTLVR